MKQFPKKLKILGVPYKVFYVNNLREADTEGKDEVFGSISHCDKIIKIYIKPPRPSEAIFITLIHEIIHAILNDAGLDFADEMREEHVIKTLASCFVSFLVDNKFVELPK